MSSHHNKFRFGRFTLDRRAYQLSADGSPIALSPRAMDLLFMLVSQPGVLFTKDEIFNALWPDVTVTDNALTQVISELRQALGDKPNAAAFIETAPRRGYRWIAAVDALDAAPVPAPASAQVDASVALQAHAATAAELQSAIVTALMAGLKVTITAAPAQRLGVRETASLDAYRLALDGRVKLETLDPNQIFSAVSDFTKALALDPAYAPAHIGLAHAHFWLYQATRVRSRPNKAELDAAIAHAERAVELDPSQADAHAALAFFLSVTPRSADALRHGRLAVSMEPGNWRHQFQLGIASWGSERLACLDVVMTQFPALTHAHFAAALVHIARGALAEADTVLAAGIAAQATSPADRFPGRGLHWLRGLIALHGGRTADARTSFERELATAGGDLFADEFAVDALSGLGFAALDDNNARAAAIAFERAIARVPDHARAWIGLSAARKRLGDERGADDARARGMQGQRDLHDHGRGQEAVMAAAMAFLLDGDINDACRTLAAFLETTAPGMALSTLPVEPWLQPFLGDTRVMAVLKQLAERAA